MQGWPKRALVVVHGIGVQRRGNTLNAFVRGLQRCGVEDASVVPVRLPFGEVLPPDALRVRRGATEADVYEIYWAPLTSNKTTAHSVLWWLLRVTFLPGDSLRKPSSKTVWDLLTGAAAALFILLIFLFGVLSLGNLTAQVACSADPQADCPAIPYEQRALTGDEVTWLRGEQILSVVGALRDSLVLTDRPLSNLSPSYAAEVLTKLSWQSLVLLAGFLYLTAQAFYRALQLLNALVQGRHRFRQNKPVNQLLLLILLLVPLGVLIQMIPPVLAAFGLVFLLLGGFARGARYFLTESIGDVQVYSERDENSAHYAAREAILDEAEKLFKVIADRGYEHIVVVGHSLGSVIAFTALDRLVRRVPELLPRIKAFITIGTALEKVRYFFERRMDTDEAASRRLIEPARTIAADRVWVNLWYENDLVANPITTFQEDGSPLSYKWRDAPALPQLLDEARSKPVVNVSFGWPVFPIPWLPAPVWTHSRYWGDKTVLELMTEVCFAPTPVPSRTRVPSMG